MPHWIVFDYGEVLCTRTTAIPELAAAMGVSAAAFEPAYWELRDAYDRGSTDLAYWTSIGERLGVEVDETKSAELTELDVAGWTHLVPSSVELLESLAEAGAALALLSNASVSFGAWVRTQEWAKLFRHLIFSGDVRCAKPDAEIYHLLLDQLGAEPADCLFFDDRESNVEGARAVGIRAHVWDGTEAARAALG
ncbi:HAD-IA family hydrolase [Amycolatopsis jiangsuensis]|uniref:Putative hydrolase of the HAD superfamily n=1 Tax=Amycolatopsis jiangsuensis TaxID=1181879 RepID=A0A840J098_9PSEU|nr:HAD-IA family hydrolase [Amycolatopsis jiangsuensis]MBB4687500.1 putative hydrolase of the HAD superfamily [Amycolatopsis jiangsuensis]